MIEILSKGVEEEKSLKDFHLIGRLLEKTELKNKFLKGEKEEKVKTRLIYFCAMNMTYKFASKREVVITEGEVADCFYIILRGKLRVLKAFEKKLSLSGEQYLKLVSRIADEGILSKATKTVDTNMTLFPINKQHLHVLKYILFILKLKLFIEKSASKNQVKELFQEFQLNILEYFKDLSQIDNNNFNRLAYLRIALNMISSKFVKDTPVDYTLYSYVEYENDLKSVIIYDNSFTVSLESGKVFGDAALDERNGVRHIIVYFRNATIQAEEDCDLGVISQEVYREYVMNEKQKVIAVEINFLTENFFFRSMTPFFFRKKFFYDFVMMETQKSYCVFREKDLLEKVFFIKEGQVELKLEKSLLEMDQLIRELIQRSNFEKDFPYSEETERLMKKFSKNDRVVHKKEYKICLLGPKEILGLESYALGLPMIYSAVITSEKSKLYWIDYSVKCSLNKET